VTDDRWEDIARRTPSADPMDLVTHGVTVPAEFVEPFPDRWPQWVPVAYEGAVLGGVSPWPSTGPGRYYRLPRVVWDLVARGFRKTDVLPRVYLGRFYALLASVDNLDALLFLDREGALLTAHAAMPSVFPDG